MKSRRKKGPIGQAEADFLPQWRMNLVEALSKCKPPAETVLGDLDPKSLSGNTGEVGWDPSNGNSGEADDDLEEEKPIDIKSFTSTSSKIMDPLQETSVTERRKEHSRPARKRTRAGKFSSKSFATSAVANYRNCSVCNQRILIPELLEHMQSHAGEYAVKCPGCDLSFVSQIHLERDPTHLHDGTNPRKERCRLLVNVPNIKQCEACDFQGTWSRLRYHHPLHETTEKNFTCPFRDCGEAFTLRVNLETHLFDQHIFKKSSDLANCQRCPLCLKQIKVTSLEEHYRKTHQATEVVHCNKCSKKFPDRATLVDHIVQHKDLFLKGMRCDICEAEGTHTVIIGRLQIREHYFTKHQVGQKLICVECDYSCFSRDSLKNHQEAEHPDPLSSKSEDKAKERPYRCDVCEPPVEFKCNAPLVSHNIRLHGAVPFKCLECSETFDLVMKLNMHKRTVHSGINLTDRKKEFSCSHCPKTLRCRASLRRHVSVAHNVNNCKFKCRKCPKEKFSTYTELYQHQRKVHRAPPVFCEECGQTVVAERFKEHMYIHTG